MEAGLRIAVGASAGGHMNELLGLLKCETGQKIQYQCIITTDTILKKKMQTGDKKVFIIGECNRKTIHKIPLTIFKVILSLLRSHSDVFITTGALPMVIYAKFTKKFFSTKIIWIDSIANIDDISMSGRWAIKFADKVYTQWPHLCDKYPEMIFAGNIL